MDTAILVFKYLGMLLSGFFGVFGLLVKFKDESGKVTPAGKVALVLIITSTLVALSSQTAQEIHSREERVKAAQRQSQEMQETMKRTETVLFEIKRGLYPLMDVSFTYWIKVPTDHLGMKSYVRRMQEEVARRGDRVDDYRKINGVLPGSRDLDGARLDSFQFDCRAPFAPSRETEPLAHTLLGNAALYLGFYKKPLPLLEHPALMDDLESADLRMGVFSELDPEGTDGDHEASYDLETQTFKIQGMEVKSARENWDGSGEIVGLPDLVGAQMILSLPSIINFGEKEVDRHLSEIRGQFELEGFAFAMAGGLRLEIWGDQWEKHTDAAGMPVYFYQFPQTLEELLALFR